MSVFRARAQSSGLVVKAGRGRHGDRRDNPGADGSDDRSPPRERLQISAPVGVATNHRNPAGKGNDTGQGSACEVERAVTGYRQRVDADSIGKTDKDADRIESDTRLHEFSQNIGSFANK